MSYYDELFKNCQIKYSYKGAMKEFQNNPYMYIGDPNSLDAFYEDYLERVKSRIVNMDLTPYLRTDFIPESIKEYMYNTEKEKNTMRGNDMIDTLTTINFNYQNDKKIKETLERLQQIQSERDQKKKEAMQEWQDENTYILKWILTKFVKDYKFDWENKTVIVWWFDGVKTHVHCMDGDEFDPEVGFMKCLFKRALGSGNAVKKYFKEKIPEMNAEIVVEDDWESEFPWPEDTEQEVEDTSIEDYVTEELEKRLAKVNY